MYDAAWSPISLPLPDTTTSLALAYSTDLGLKVASVSSRKHVLNIRLPNSHLIIKPTIQQSNIIGLNTKNIGKNKIIISLNDVSSRVVYDFPCGKPQSLLFVCEGLVLAAVFSNSIVSRGSWPSCPISFVMIL